ncbi:MAG: ATP-binding cassette domain-containing protein [Burkholderiaceae bacterium]
MIRLRGLGLARGGKPLLEGADAAISPSEKIALIGPNGSGKTTLLRALAGEIVVDAGEIDRPAMRVVRLEQGLPVGALPAWRHVVESDPVLRTAQASLDAALAADDGHAIGEAHASIAEAGGLDAPARARSLLHGLGFDSGQADAPVDTLSGGWRMRLNLAQALFVPSDLLLLDEPTNHLDLDAILWLERWLARYEGSCLIVSHDRDFLDAVVHATLSIEDRRLVRYPGGYSACERQRAERQALAERSFRRDSERAAQLQRFIDRFRAKASKARQVQSRLKALERLDLAAPLRAASGLDFGFPQAGECPDPLMLAEGVAAGYETPVLRDIDLTIERGARIGLLGRNGAGKTTLIRTLTGELPALEGRIQRAASARIGYFAQQGVERLRADDSPLAHMARVAPQAREAELRGFLGRFGFRGEDALRPIGPMSGGEKARVLLAELVHGKPQLLVLDEPTNHLDAAARDALTEALAEFDGALLLVSHDRYLLRASVDRFIRVHDGRVDAFDGDLDDYAAWLQGRERTATPSTGDRPGAPGSLTPADAPTDATARGSRRDERRAAAERRARLAVELRPLDRELAAIEGQLAQLEAEIGAIDSAMADPGFHADGARVAEAARRRGECSQRAEALELRWLEVGEARDRILAGTQEPG